MRWRHEIPFRRGRDGSRRRRSDAGRCLSLSLPLSVVGPAATGTRSGSCSCVQQRRGGRSGCTRDAANARVLSFSPAIFLWSGGWMGIGSVRRIAPSSSSLLILWPCCASLSSHGEHCRIPAVIPLFHSRSLDLPAARFVAWYCAILTDRLSSLFSFSFTRAQGISKTRA
jgi:hypothetical protein